MKLRRIGWFLTALLCLSSAHAESTSDLGKSLLRQAAQQTKNLPAQEKVEAQLRIATAASGLHMTETERWIDELLISAKQLDASAHPLGYQARALEILASFKPEKAMNRLVLLPGSSDADDPRAVAARPILQRMWASCKQTCAAQMYDSAVMLAQYKIAPYDAIDGVLEQVAKADPGTAEQLSGLAVRAYRQGIGSDDVGFVDLLSDMQKAGNAALVKEGVDLAVAKLFSSDAPPPPDAASNAVTVGLGKNGGPVTTQTEIQRARRELYDLVASLDADQSHALELKDPTLRLPEPEAPQVGVMYAQGHKFTAGAQFSVSAMFLSQRIAKGEMSRTDVGLLTDPLMRAAGLAFYSQQSGISPAVRDQLLADAHKAIAASDDSFQKLRALAILAKMAIKAGDLDLASTAIKEAFAFGPGLADQELENDETKKITESDAYSGLERMVDAVVPRLIANVLAEINHLHNPGIRVFLLIRVAQQLQHS